MTDWDLVYAHLVTATGWSWSEIDELTVPRYRALSRYWDRYPPAHLLLRTLVKFTPPAPAWPSHTGAVSFDALAAMSPTGTLNIADLNRL